jgi:hypothetical protein
VTRNRRPILWMLLLFAAPLAGAFWLYYGSGWRPTGTTRHGELIEPVRELPPLALADAGKEPGKNVLTGQWTLLVVGSGESGCDAGCRESLVYARQTWLSLGRENARVRRLLLAGEGCCDAGYLRNEHQGLAVASGATTGAGEVRAAIPEPREHTVFIVDPLGNLMMRYDVRQDPKGLREDLKKLLDLSHIG